jgi:hypothetical protein
MDCNNVAEIRKLSISSVVIAKTASSCIVDNTIPPPRPDLMTLPTLAERPDPKRQEIEQQLRSMGFSEDKVALATEEALANDGNLMEALEKLGILDGDSDSDS